MFDQQQLLLIEEGEEGNEDKRKGKVSNRAAVSTGKGKKTGGKGGRRGKGGPSPRPAVDNSARGRQRTGNIFAELCQVFEERASLLLRVDCGFATGADSRGAKASSCGNSEEGFDLDDVLRFIREGVPVAHGELLWLLRQRSGQAQRSCFAMEVRWEGGGLGAGIEGEYNV